MPYAGVPIEVMRSEHQQGRSLLKLMAEIAQAYRNGAPGAAQRWVEISHVYTTMMRFHIDVENRVLLSMAENLLTDAEQSELAGAFEKGKEEKEKVVPATIPDSTSYWIG